MNIIKLNILLLALIFLSLLNGCNENGKNPTPSYVVPTTYNFENVDYSGQTLRIAMLEELIAEAEKGNVAGTEVDLQRLKNLYSNIGNPFSDVNLNSSGKQLKDKTFSFTQPKIEDYLTSLSDASKSNTPGTNGVAGVVISNDGTRSKLCDANGFVLYELIEKGLMGALLYYQATEVYLGEDKIGTAVDNKTVTPGKGTVMEHSWDEAFGYFGVDKNFPANEEGVAFWSSYVLSKSEILGGSKDKLMNAFIKGRAAISNNDMATKDDQVKIIREEWERLVAAMAISYLNKGITSSSPLDNARRNGALSEAAGFIEALQYNPSKKISNDQINIILGLIGNNLYTSTVPDIRSARDQLSTIYNMDNIKATL